jgi:hypothetical protein
MSPEETIMFDAQEPADKYVAVWNEPIAKHRWQQIAAGWVPEGQHYVDVRKAFCYAALERRITDSHSKNVADAGHRFRSVKDARTLHDVALFHWEMPPAAEERAAARGLEVLCVAAEGCILVDFQFIV